MKQEEGMEKRVGRWSDGWMWKEARKIGIGCRVGGHLWREGGSENWERGL